MSWVVLRALLTISAVAFFLTVSGLGLWQYRRYTAEQRQIAELERQRAELAAQKAQLEQVLARLTAERRVAEILVTDRQISGDGVPVTKLLFVEYARDGSTLPPRSFVVRGEMVHVNGLVIEFPSEAVRQRDGLRGHSIILFDRIYGSAERPDAGQLIDRPGRIPELYRASSPEASSFEMRLWADFWRLATDEAYRNQQGVKLANGKSVYGPFLPDRLYTITLDAQGKMSCRDEPIKGAVGEALRRMSSTQ